MCNIDLLWNGGILFSIGDYKLSFKEFKLRPKLKKPKIINDSLSRYNLCRSHVQNQTTEYKLTFKAQKHYSFRLKRLKSEFSCQ